MKKDIGIEAYPLCWPRGWKRFSEDIYRVPSRFKTPFARARDSLMKELRLMRATLPILSTNIPLKRNGLPYATYAEPHDPGVAVYFQYNGKSMVFACDAWKRVAENVQAIRKTIEAIRGIERWAASDMIERAFSGFLALEAPSNENWWDTLGVQREATLTECRNARNHLMKLYHPDTGANGSHDRAVKISRAYQEAIEIIGG